jgi:methylamine---glutamate N-methyltransferase subunit B
MRTVDLATTTLRELNSDLHRQTASSNEGAWEIVNPMGHHAVAVGVDAPISIDIRGSVGYYCAGMNKLATVTVHGSAGPGVAENMMSGKVHITGDASQYAGATGRGGLLVIEGNAASRCGVSMKGIDIVVKGNIGHMSAFMFSATPVMRWVIPFTKPSCSCAAVSKASALIASRRTCGPSIMTSLASCLRRPDATA